MDRCKKEVLSLRELDNLVLNAKADTSTRESLIRQQEFYILKCASKTSHRYITKSDDEWSVSLLAFSQAIDSYELDKGSFLSFAELVIKRRLIDYSKSQGKYNSEVFVDPILFDAPPEEEEDDIEIRLAVAEQVSKQDTGDIKLEIDTANAIFAAYGFTFFELSECSPRAAKTKKSCASAVNYLLHNPLLIQEMRDTRQLSLKNIEKNAKVPRKILERHRKYIIAATELLSGEYPKLAEYLHYIKESGGY
jgi:RNA polymerase sigma factor